MAEKQLPVEILKDWDKTTRKLRKTMGQDIQGARKYEKCIKCIYGTRINESKVYCPYGRCVEEG